MDGHTMGGSGSQSKASEGLGFRTRVKGLIMVSCK